MVGTQKVRGKVNVVLNRLVREGAITGFRTNFDQQGGAADPHMGASVAEEGSPEVARALIVNALTEVATDIDVTVERA